MAAKAKEAKGHEPGTVNSKQLAEVLDCTPRMVEKYAEQDLVVRVSRGRYHFLMSVKNVIAHLRKQASLQMSADGKNDQVEENVLLRRSQRRIAELKIAQLERTMISVSEIEDVWLALVLANRQLIQSIPGRIRKDCPNVTGHEQKIIQQICHDLLTETALGKGQMPPISAISPDL